MASKIRCLMLFPLFVRHHSSHVLLQNLCCIERGIVMPRQRTIGERNVCCRWIVEEVKGLTSLLFVTTTTSFVSSRYLRTIVTIPSISGVGTFGVSSKATLKVALPFTGNFINIFRMISQDAIENALISHTKHKSGIIHCDICHGLLQNINVPLLLFDGG